MNIAVFIVNDHAAIRDGLRLLLETQPDIEVVGDATTGPDAVQAIAKLHPDVVITDIFMSRLDGFETTLQIHESCPSTRIIVLSMYSTVEHILRAMQAGSSGYLLKESVGVEIVSAVRSVHAGQRYLSRKISSRTIDDCMHRSEGRKKRDAFSLRALTRSAASA